MMIQLRESQIEVLAEDSVRRFCGRLALVVMDDVPDEVEGLSAEEIAAQIEAALPRLESLGFDDELDLEDVLPLLYEIEAMPSLGECPDWCREALEADGLDPAEKIELLIDRYGEELRAAPQARES